ncbi:MAG: amino acid ABC transporter permease [Kiritimatiellae bacterium]|nr:amino acid ABC transporter permease [Kiritimatiellia bacterium]MBR4251210.1 amino acid ABC transporter permease [Kiritimatiellia bacterium]
MFGTLTDGGWAAGQWQMLRPMLLGSVVSLEVFALTLALSIPLSIPIAFGRMSKWAPLRRLVNGYLLVMRGTPLILQILFAYFAPYYILGVSIYTRFAAVIVAFVLNYAAYFAEIFRGGIESIPRGQWEAAQVLGFTPAQTFFRIVLPQVVKRTLPAVGNEVITLVKDTALAQTIGVAELFRAAQTISAARFSVVPIFVAGAFYFLMNGVVSVVFNHLERRLSYYS